MKESKGVYRYKPHRSLWGIWLYKSIGGAAKSGTFIKDCKTKEEAEREVYALNGWKNKVK